MANEITRDYNKASAVYIIINYYAININPVWTLLDHISPLQLNAACTHTLHMYSHTVTCTHTLSHVLTHYHMYSRTVTYTHTMSQSHSVTCTHTLSHVLTHCNMYLHTG